MDLRYIKMLSLQQLVASLVVCLIWVTSTSQLRHAQASSFDTSTQEIVETITREASPPPLEDSLFAAIWPLERNLSEIQQKDKNDQRAGAQSPAWSIRDYNKTHHQRLKLETSGQFDDPINEIKKQRPTDISLYQTIKGQNSNNGTRASDEAALQIRGLDRDFLSLFDELWKIKNTSMIALIKLDYFTNETKVLEQQSLANNQTSSSDQTGDDLEVMGNNTTTASNTTTNRGTPHSRNHKQQQRTQLSPLAVVANKLTSWIVAMQRNSQTAMEGLRNHLSRKLALMMGKKSLTGRENQIQLEQQRRQQQLLLEMEQRRQLNSSQNSTAKPTDIFEESDKPDRVSLGEEPAPNNTRVLTKRATTLEQQLSMLHAGGHGHCNVLTSEEEVKCRLSETQISSTLNNSFPGTPKAIEDNCKLITSLFTNCWPQQLQQLRNSLSSWNESLLIHTDFALPAGLVLGADPKQTQTQAQTAASCGLAPQMPQFLRDRVNWMLLNLCVDKKFRQDYVDNLRCLSTWNQEKAQQVCSHEYKRMQNYLASQAETGNAGLSAGFEWAHGPNNQQARQPTAIAKPSPAPGDLLDASKLAGSKATTNDNNGNLPNSMDEDMPGFGDTLMAATTPPRLVGSAGGGGGGGVKVGHLSESELTNREVSSKMLCCMFDQFLRCVHKQAVRDCGRPGAQFVVNFMSRIGTDDMKYLCNSETKTVARGSKTSGRRGGGGGGGGSGGGGSGSGSSGSHEGRSPFIEGHYCTDPRIQTGLFNNQLDQGGSLSGGTGAGSKQASGSGSGALGGSSKTSASSRNKFNDRTNINHDPTFFGSDRVVQSNTAAVAATSVPSRLFNQVHVILALLIALVSCVGSHFVLTNTDQFE